MQPRGQPRPPGLQPPADHQAAGPQGPGWRAALGQPSLGSSSRPSNLGQQVLPWVLCTEEERGLRPEGVVTGSRPHGQRGAGVRAHCHPPCKQPDHMAVTWANRTPAGEETTHAAPCPAGHLSPGGAKGHVSYSSCVRCRDTRSGQESSSIPHAGASPRHLNYAGGPALRVADGCAHGNQSPGAGRRSRGRPCRGPSCPRVPLGGAKAATLGSGDRWLPPLAVLSVTDTVQGLAATLSSWSSEGTRAPKRCGGQGVPAGARRVLGETAALLRRQGWAAAGCSEPR